MFTRQDEIQIANRGSLIDEVRQQIENFKRGFPFLPVTKAASPENGILRVTPADMQKYSEVFDESVSTGLTLMKFVPASGAASRMFKSLYTALGDLRSGKDENEVLGSNQDAREFYERIGDFAFCEKMKESIQHDNAELSLRNYLEYLLTEKGLTMGTCPRACSFSMSIRMATVLPSRNTSWKEPIMHATIRELSGCTLPYQQNMNPDSVIGSTWSGNNTKIFSE